MLGPRRDKLSGLPTSLLPSIPSKAPGTHSLSFGMDDLETARALGVILGSARKLVTDEDVPIVDGLTTVRTPPLNRRLAWHSCKEGPSLFPWVHNHRAPIYSSPKHGESEAWLTGRSESGLRPLDRKDAPERYQSMWPSRRLGLRDELIGKLRGVTHSVRTHPVERWPKYFDLWLNSRPQSFENSQSARLPAIERSWGI